MFKKKKNTTNSTRLQDVAPESRGAAAVCQQITEMFMRNKAAYSNLKLGNEADATPSSKQSRESPASAGQSPHIDPPPVKQSLPTADPAPRCRKHLCSRLQHGYETHVYPRLCRKMRISGETSVHGNIQSKPCPNEPINKTPVRAV